MLADGGRLSRLWLYVFVQMLDDYTNVLRHADIPAAARMCPALPHRGQPRGRRVRRDG
jgi:hypothetical protein